MLQIGAGVLGVPVGVGLGMLAFSVDPLAVRHRTLRTTLEAAETDFEKKQEANEDDLSSLTDMVNSAEEEMSHLQLNLNQRVDELRSQVLVKLKEARGKKLIR
jgi:uncharacterized FlaG/YvyC family protein